MVDMWPKRWGTELTQGETMDELRRMVQDAVRCHFEPEERPGVIRLHILKQEVLPV